MEKNYLTCLAVPVKAPVSGLVCLCELTHTFFSVTALYPGTFMENNQWQLFNTAGALSDNNWVGQRSRQNLKGKFEGKIYMVIFEKFQHIPGNLEEHMQVQDCVHA